MSEEVIVDYVAGPRHVQPSRTDGSTGDFFFSVDVLEMLHVYMFLCRSKEICVILCRKGVLVGEKYKHVVHELYQL